MNGLTGETLQVTTPEEVNAYMAAMGYNQGGFGYIELTYDEAAALAAAAALSIAGYALGMKMLGKHFKPAGVA